MATLHRNLIVLVIIFNGFRAANAQEAQFPIVKSHGGIYEIPDAVEFPEKDVVYRIVVDLKTGANSTMTVNPALYNLARMVNLHGLGGVAKENLKVIAVVHGEATTAVLTDESYEKRFNTKNPNTEMIQSLAEAGVSLFICGQSLIARKVDTDELASDIAISLSAVTLLTTYQLDGYALISF